MRIGRIGDHATFLSGFAFKSKLFNEDGIGVPVIRIRDVIRGYSETFFSGDYDEKYLVKSGEYLIGMDGEFNLAKWQSQPALLNQRVCKIDSLSSDLDKSYFAKYLPKVLREIEDETPFVTVKHLSVKKLNDAEIPLPPLAEQKRIAAILDKADELRTKRRESLAQLDQLIQSTFLEMFGDPVTNPKGWEVKSMGQTCDLITGFAFPSDKFIKAGKGIALCRGINVGLGTTNWKDRVDWPVHYDSQLSRFELQKGDIVLAMDRPWISGGLKVATTMESDLPALLVQRVTRIRATAIIEQSLIYALIRNKHFELHCNPTETTVPHISPKDLKSFPIMLPPLNLQKHFASVVQSIEQQKTRIQTHLTELDTLFASLQSRAFNGEL
jgi:type I restriction enzyme, S subunit